MARHSLIVLSLLASATALAQDEARQRNDELVKQGYNLTQGITLPGRPARAATRIDLFVPEAGPHTFSFWADGTGKELAFRIVAADGAALASWAGARGELTVTLELPAGGIAVEILQEAPVRAVLGIKGGITRACDAPPGGTVEEHAAAPEKGFRWPYLLYVPKQAAGSRLLVAPNSTGFVSDDPYALRLSASCEVRRQASLADRLGTPLLVPLFPRPSAPGDAENLYLHALTRPALEARAPAHRRVDLQLIAMIDDARAGRSLDERVLMMGFSASAMFANRFTFLHPERVARVAVGAPGGWPIAPLPLPYPVGIGDVRKLTGKPVDLEALRGVEQFLWLGAEDENDSVPFRDSYSRASHDLVMKKFGPTPVSRWKAAEELYAAAGLRATFKLYPGVAHSVTPEVAEDIARFLSGP